MPSAPKLQQHLSKLAASSAALAVTFHSEAAHAKSVLGVNGGLDFGPLAGDQPGGEGTGKVRSQHKITHLHRAPSRVGGARARARSSEQQAPHAEQAAVVIIFPLPCALRAHGSRCAWLCELGMTAQFTCMAAAGEAPASTCCALPARENLACPTTNLSAHRRLPRTSRRAGPRHQRRLARLRAPHCYLRDWLRLQPVAVVPGRRRRFLRHVRFAPWRPRALQPQPRLSGSSGRGWDMAAEDARS